MMKKFFYSTLLFLSFGFLITCESYDEYTIIRTGGVKGVTAFSAEITGHIVLLSKATHSEYGICVSITKEPDIEELKAGLTGVKEGPFEVKISDLEPNTNYFYRTYIYEGENIIYGEEKSFSTTKSQLDVSTSTENVGSDANSITFEISSNTDWTIENDVDWFSTSDSSGNGNKTITVTIDENSSTKERSGKIFIEGNGADNKEISVFQSGAEAILNVSIPSKDINALSGSFTFEVVSNTEWSIGNTANWIQIDKSTEGNNIWTITVTYEGNNTTNSRNALISISASDIETKTQTISQSGAEPFLEIAGTPDELSALSGSFSFNITTNTEWTITSSSEWLNIDETSGNGSKTINVTYDENYSSLDRSDDIIVSISETYKQTIEIQQAGTAPSLELSLSSKVVPSDEGDFTFDINANVDWEVKEYANWVQVDVTSGTGNYTISVSFDENIELTERTANITVSSNIAENKTILLTQSAAGASLTLSMNSKEIPAPSGEFTFEIGSNGSWNVSEDSDWISLSVNSGTGNDNILVTYKENSSIDERTADITVSTNDGGIAKQLSVNQMGIVLDISIKSNQSLSESAESFSFDIFTKHNWIINNDAEWLQFKNLSGEGSTLIEVGVSENTSFQTRSAQITVTAEGVNKSFKINQKGRTPVLSPDKNFLNVSKKAGSFQIAISSNLDWEVTIDKQWASLDVGSGTGDYALKVNYEENVTIEERNATITFSSDQTEDVTFLLLQEGVEHLIISPGSKFVSSSVGSISFDVQSNVNWQITNPSGWLNLSSANGDEDNTIFVNYEENSEMSERSATLIISADGFDDQNFILTQAGAGPTLDASLTEIEIGSAGGDIQLDIASNVTWSVSGIPSWLNLSRTSGSGDKTITVAIDENTSVNQRQGSFTISGDGVADLNISVIQEAAEPFITSSPNELNLIYTSGSEQIEISSNTTWTLTESSVWFSASPSTGTGNGTITINYSGNVSENDRSDVITLSGADTEDVIVTVNQSGVKQLDVSESSKQVSYSSGSFNFSISSNTDWTISESATWFSVNKSSGTGNSIISVSYDENTTTNSRSENITISGTGAPSRTLQLNQDGAPAYLNLSAYSKDITRESGSFTFFITSNTDWVISESSNWFSISPTSGFGDATITVNYNENTQPIDRSESLTVSAFSLDDKIMNINQDRKEVVTGTFVDSRDGSNYGWVEIGNQVWMSEDLEYQQNEYNWNDAMTACPSGWHLPSDDEWKTLESALGMPSSELNNTTGRGEDENIGGMLKSTSSWDSPNVGATNEVGFNGTSPDGYLVIYWTSTLDTDDSFAWRRDLYHHSSYIYRLRLITSATERVRCVKD